MSVKRSTTTASNQHEGVRRDHATELAEDYVEAIAEIYERQGECRLKEIAKHFAVSHVTANRTVARLKRDGLVTHEPYGPIHLTPAGKRLAEKSRKRHEIVVGFLIALGVSDETAKMDAEGIEHHVSQETLKQMEKFVRSQEEPC